MGIFCKFFHMMYTSFANLTTIITLLFVLMSNKALVLRNIPFLTGTVHSKITNIKYNLMRTLVHILCWPIQHNTINRSIDWYCSTMYRKWSYIVARMLAHANTLDFSTENVDYSTIEAKLWRIASCSIAHSMFAKDVTQAWAQCF